MPDSCEQVSRGSGQPADPMSPHRRRCYPLGTRSAGSGSTLPSHATDYCSDVGGGFRLAIGEGFDEVLNAARAGAPWAFERLYTDLAPAVAGYLRLQSAAEPEDLTSEAFLGVFARLSSFQGTEQKFRSWVFTIAHRRLIDERRRAVRNRSTPTASNEILDRIGGDTEQDALAVIGSRRVYELCAELSDDQREVLILRIVGDLTVEQVSLIVDKSVGAVKALQRRALTSLRRRVEREGVPL
jgi:RNA polymerase sigma factor (sigma-70 family)